MNDIADIAGRSLAVLIIFLFFLLLYCKLAKKDLSDVWNDFKHILGGK